MGILRLIEKDHKEIEYFKDVQKIKTKNVPTEESSYFTFLEDTTLDVLKNRWSWKKYLKGLLKFKFNLDNGYEFWWNTMKFYGINTPILHDSMEDFVKEKGERALYELLDTDRKVKVFIEAEPKSKNYDLVLGELSTDGRSVSNVYRCKLEKDQNINVVHVGKVDIGPNKVNYTRVRQIKK